MKVSAGAVELERFKAQGIGKGQRQIVRLEPEFAGLAIEAGKAGQRRLDVLDALAGGVAHLHGHDGAGDALRDLPGDAAGLGAAAGREPAAADDLVEVFGQPVGQPAEGVAMRRLELGALRRGAMHLGGELAIDGREFLDGLAGAVGQLRDVGSEDIEIVVVADDAGGNDAGIDGDDAHHLDGAAEVGDRDFGAVDHRDQPLDGGLLGGERGRDFTGAATDGGEAGRRLGQLGAGEVLRQRLKRLRNAVEQGCRLAEPVADRNEARLDPGPRLAQIGGERHELAPVGQAGGGWNGVHRSAARGSPERRP